MSFQPRQNRVQLPWFIFELNLQEGEIRNMSVKTSCRVLPEVDEGQRTFIFMLLRHVNHNRLQSAILKSSTQELEGNTRIPEGDGTFVQNLSCLNGRGKPRGTLGLLDRICSVPRPFKRSSSEPVSRPWVSSCGGCPFKSRDKRLLSDLCFYLN